MIETLLIILQSVSYQFQYLSNLLCEVTGGGCSMSLGDSSITVLGMEMSGYRAMLVAVLSELFGIISIKLFFVGGKASNKPVLDSNNI